MQENVTDRLRNAKQNLRPSAENIFRGLSYAAGGGYSMDALRHVAEGQYTSTLTSASIAGGFLVIGEVISRRREEREKNKGIEIGREIETTLEEVLAFNNLFLDIFGEPGSTLTAAVINSQIPEEMRATSARLALKEERNNYKEVPIEEVIDSILEEFLKQDVDIKAEDEDLLKRNLCSRIKNLQEMTHWLFTVQGINKTILDLATRMNENEPLVVQLTEHGQIIHLPQKNKREQF